MNQSTPLLTVFTPAYNRAHTITRTYESLCRQTLKKFYWLIIDDGSIDGTSELVQGWIKDGRVPIIYIYQKNQGMHGAHNTAYRNIHTELNTCIDSDDYMPDNAVELIEKIWEKHRSKEYAGVIGLDITIDGQLIGKEFPDSMKSTTLTDYYLKGGAGDKKMVYRTDVIKATAEYPLFPDEKYVGLGCRYFEIDQKYELLTLNKALVVVEYQEDGSSMNMYQQYWNNPRGFIYMRCMDMKYYKSLRQKFRAATHYVASSIRAAETSIIQKSPLPFITAICYLPGLMLYFYTKRMLNKKLIIIKKP